MHMLSLPIHVPFSTRKNFSLNLNVYRNAHYRDLHKAKLQFTEDVKDAVLGLPIFKKIRLTYILFWPNKSRVDVANVCSIVDKFFADALVEYRRIEDDSSLHIDEVVYRFGGVDQKRARVEVTIDPVVSFTEKEDHMKIILDQAEVKDVLTAHVQSQFSLAQNQEVGLDFSHGDQGFEAIISIRPKTATAPADPKPVTRRSLSKPTVTPAPVSAADQPVEAEQAMTNPLEAAPEAPTETESTPEPAAEPAAAKAAENPFVRGVSPSPFAPKPAATSADDIGGDAPEAKPIPVIQQRTGVFNMAVASGRSGA